MKGLFKFASLRIILKKNKNNNEKLNENINICYFKAFCITYFLTIECPLQALLLVIHLRT